MVPDFHQLLVARETLKRDIYQYPRRLHTVRTPITTDRRSQ
jgi:hypothetical protein